MRFNRDGTNVLSLNSSLSCFLIRFTNYRIITNETLQRYLRLFETRPDFVSNVFGKPKTKDRLRRPDFLFFQKRVEKQQALRTNVSVFVIFMRDRIAAMHASWPRAKTRGSVNRRFASQDTVQKFGGAARINKRKLAKIRRPRRNAEDVTGE